MGDVKIRCFSMGFCKVNRKKSFNHVKHKNDTELSKEFWEIKRRNGTPKII